MGFLRLGSGEEVDLSKDGGKEKKRAVIEIEERSMKEVVVKLTNIKGEVELTTVGRRGASPASCCV